MDQDRAEHQQKEEQAAYITSKKLFECRIFSLIEDQITFTDQHQLTRQYFSHPGAVVILPVQDDGSILLIKQYRRPIKHILWELPAGLLEGKEDPKKRAMLELREETGYGTKELIPFGGMFTAPGLCNEYLHLFIAKGLYPAPLDPDDDEAIDLMPTPLTEALNMVDNGTINDAKTIVGLLKYERWIKA